MSDRTASQQAADNALRDALIACDRAYDTEDVPAHLMTHYVVVQAAVPVADSDESTILGVTYSEGSMPAWQAIGLLDLARHKLIHDWVTNHDPADGAT